MIRTHEAGTLRAAGRRADRDLAGWVGRRRDHGGVAFLDLRDASGVVQVVVRDPEVAHPLRNEYCVKVVGEVVGAVPRATRTRTWPPATSRSWSTSSRCSPRPRRCRSRSTSTSRSARRPGCATATSTCAGPSPARDLRLRSKVNQIAREVLLARDFLEIETPTLTRSTPEGARDFLVPVRLQPGQLVRPAAVPAAVQAAADGRRHGALLPDRALLPRRGLPRRPAAGVHPARHRDVASSSRTT